MNLEKKILELEEKLADNERQLAEKMAEYKKIVEASHLDSGCIDRKNWSKMNAIHQEISSLQVAIQGVPEEIHHHKASANKYARAAYLNERRVNPKAKLEYPYPEIRG